jgi:WD40 repeat protein
MTDRTDRPAAAPRRVTVVTPGLAAMLSLLALGAVALPSLLPGERSPAREVLGTHPGVIRTLAFAPDGGTLAVGGIDGAVSRWTVATRQGRLVRPPLGDAFGALALAPDVTRVAIGRLGVGVTVYSLVTGQAACRFPADAWLSRSLAFAPRDAGFAVGQADGRVILYSATGHQTADLGKVPAPVAIVVFAPDGWTLAVADVRGTVAVWDVASGRQTACFPHVSHPLNDLVFAPDGTRLVATSATLPCPLLFDLATGREQVVVLGAADLHGAVAFAPDGRTLAMSRGDGAVVLWDQDGQRSRGGIRGRHRGLVWALAFSPDGRRLASGGDDMTVRLWDVPVSAGR